MGLWLHALNTEVADMSFAMNEKHAFARIERSLAREDPELARRMSAINSQFTDLADERVTAQARERCMDPADSRAMDQAVEEDAADRPRGDGDGRSWTAVIAVVLVAVAILGLLLAVTFSSPNGKQEPSQPHGLAPPAVSAPLGEWPSLGVP
ncbi:DUF3040 domain-containing protein [Streptomyces sp. NPDC057438]|uniref:DUF3040 domain-containing protein n=1 Tax=Streptomyces sp. NPDC057438 TaxID=3346133 RepID=UPI0036AF8DAD